MCISRRMLERQLDWLGRRYRFITLEELGARMQWGDRFTEPVAVVTFDDGYHDVYENAFPLLKQKGIPAAVFVVTDLLGTDRCQIHDVLYLQLVRAYFKWGSPARILMRFLAGLGISLRSTPRTAQISRDPHTALEVLLETLPQAQLLRMIEALKEEVKIPAAILREHRAMSWEELAEMHRAGITVGSHTRSHTLLTMESAERVQEEVSGSKRELESRLGAKIKHFAYPCGQFDAAAVRAVGRAGYKYAFTICRHRDEQFPLLTIPRRLLWQNSCLGGRGSFSAAIMSCQVNGSFDTMAACRMNHTPVGETVRAA